MEKRRKIKNTEEYINIAKTIHGENEYDYSEVVYVDYRTKVWITHKKCGHRFQQMAGSHIKGHGCSICARIKKGPKRSTTEEFIEKAIKIHGENEFIYNEVVYEKNNIKIWLTHKCGHRFQMMPMAHLNGQGCPECGRKNTGLKRRTDPEIFLNKIKEIHNEKYDLSKTRYVTSNMPVCVICHEIDPITGEEHGEFLIKPMHLLQGKGCKKCGIQNMKMKQRSNKEEFKEKAIQVHGEDEFNYNEVVYINSQIKVWLTHNKCGHRFEITPHSHLQGQSCPLCRYKTISSKLVSNTEEFEEKGKVIHGNNEYNYEKVVYINSKTKVLLIHNVCGHEFLMCPDHHLQGQGCPYCKQSQLETQIQTLLVNNNIIFNKWQRFDWLKYKNPMSLDFYLLEHNIAIECQGEQHFIYKRKNPLFKESVELIRDRDITKYNLCKENGIRILYYTNVNKNIIPKTYMDTIYTNKEELLNEILKNKL